MTRIEHRAAAELRAAGRRLEGRAAVFDQPATIATFSGGFVEIIRPGAFTRSLASGRDVLALADHDMRAVLGRTRSGTLRLSEDAQGLAFEVDLPETRLAGDLLALAERGDLGGASFAFNVPKGGERWRAGQRELIDLDLEEISIVQATPAYAGTSVVARAAGQPVGLVLARLRSEWI